MTPNKKATPPKINPNQFNKAQVPVSTVANSMSAARSRLSMHVRLGNLQRKV